ncbi:hypothetical protein Trydic_g21627 [Trypoxylus dichotomus]
MFLKLQLFLSAFIVLSSSLKLPSYIELCKLSDPELNECMKNNGNAALSSILKGDKQYKVRSFIPLRSPEMNLNIGESLKFTIKNASMAGFETSRIQKVRFDFNAKYVELIMHFDYIHVEGNYEMNGELLVIPIFGNGYMNVSLSQPVCTYTMDFEIISKGGEKHYSIVKADADLRTRKVTFYFSNLFNGNERLGNNMNQFINDNWADVYGELKYSINNLIKTLVNDVLEAYFDKVPVEDFFIS